MNLVFFIVSDGEKSKEMSKRFVHKLQQTDILRHFEKIYKKSADRVLKRQINIVHIESGIQCFILFQKTSRIVESTEIVKRFAANSLCKRSFLVVEKILAKRDDRQMLVQCFRS